MKDGLEEIDRAQLPVWLGATSEGHGLYLKMGFRDIESLQGDLSLCGGEGIIPYIGMMRAASSQQDV